RGGVGEEVSGRSGQGTGDPRAYVGRSRRAPATLAAAVRAEVAALDKELPVYDVRPLEEYVSAALDARRFVMLLGALFAAVALVVAAIGTYGVVACSVTQREHEFGVRRALGAGSGDVLRLVFREGLVLSAAGPAVGLIAAAATTPALRGLLFRVGVADPLTYAAVAGAEIVAALLACWLPARRAVRSEPLDALRVS